MKIDYSDILEQLLERGLSMDDALAALVCLRSVEISNPLTLK